MTTIKLTKTEIDRLTYSGHALRKGWSRDIRWDTEVPGLGVRIYPSDGDRFTKTFVLSYRIAGRKRLLKLGRFGVLTLDEARKRARRHLVAVSDGEDPKESKSRQKRQGTLRELATSYFSEREAKGVKTIEKMKQRFDRNIPRSWLPRLAASITRSEIRGLHAKIGARAPYEANRTLEILRAMFRKGISGAFNDPDTGVWFFESESAANQAKEIDKFPEKKRTRFVSESELPILVAEIDKRPNVYVRGALWCYLLTGARKEELLAVRRDRGNTTEPYIDWQAETLELPDPKSGENQSIPLSGAAVAILQALDKVEGNPYIFVGHKKGQHLVNINKPWGEIRAAAGLDDIRIHDLRRTVGSWLSSHDIDLNTIKHALRHASISTTLTYARLGQEPARAALEDHGRRVMEIAGKRVAAGGD